jgi:hypothetical protein
LRVRRAAAPHPGGVFPASGWRRDFPRHSAHWLLAGLRQATVSLDTAPVQRHASVALKFRALRAFVMLPFASHSRRRIIVAAAIWLAAIGVGFCLMVDYQTSPGAAGVVSTHWPHASRLIRDPQRPNLLMFVHPQCPCTRASLGELAKIMTDAKGLVAAQVVLVVPPGAGEEWKTTDLWRLAGEIPGVRLVTDDNGRERERFGVETSGHVLLYDAGGELIFSGGITASRGESGENAGSSSIVELLRHEPADRSETFVFGCPLGDRCLEPPQEVVGKPIEPAK